MIVKSLMIDGHFSLRHYQEIFNSARAWILLSHSLLLSSATALTTVVIGVPLGVLLVKTDLKLKKFFTLLLVVPLLVPPYILAIAWFYCLGRSGIVARIFGQGVGRITSGFLFGFPGTLFVMVSAFVPIVIILTMTYLRMINPRLEEAGRLSAKWWHILARISVPIISPGVFLAGLMVFVLSLGEFGVPLSLRYNVFPVESFTQFSAFYDFKAATATAIPLSVIVLLILIVERLFLRKRTFQFRISRPDEMIVIPLEKKANLLLTSFVGFIVFIWIVVPVGVLLAKSFSMETYYQAFVHSFNIILRSLHYAAAGATILLILGFFLGYLLQRSVFRLRYAADSAAIFLFTLPGTVIGMGLISLWNTRATKFIYASAIIILFGNIAKYTALSERIMASTFSQIPLSMEEAGQVAGGRWFRRLFSILIPLSKKGLVASWLVGFIFCLRDLDITMIVYPPAHETLPVRIFTLMANAPEQEIAALCLIMILITLMPLGLLMVAPRYL